MWKFGGDKPDYVMHRNLPRGGAQDEGRRTNLLASVAINTVTTPRHAMASAESLLSPVPERHAKLTRCFE